VAFRIRFWETNRTGHRLVGRLVGSDQEVRIERSVLEHFRKWRQRSSRATEAGGQIFGVVSRSHVDVKKATGPYSGDERERYRYRSDPQAAQRSIDDRALEGLVYLGEWHTHAEDIPRASATDLEAIKALRGRSTLCVSSLLLLIVGRSAFTTGLSVYSIDVRQDVRRWACHLVEGRTEVTED
jgi:integrative and conjugative element protein (TIGR02256 family)